jgi:hypothetical protein
MSVQTESNRHPLIGQEYTVSEYDTPIMDADSVVPVGYDDFGNLQVEQFADDESRVVLYNDDEFVRAVDDGDIVEGQP